MNYSARTFPVIAALVAAPFAHAQEGPKSFEVGGLSFERPADWKWVQVASMMRKAQLSVPSKGDLKAAEIVFFHFGQGSGGSVQENAQRWLNQFDKKPDNGKTEETSLGGKKVYLVSTEGVFQSGMPGGAMTPMENYALLGAMVEGPEGLIFVKMTGPKATITESREKFLAFIGSAKK